MFKRIFKTAITVILSALFALCAFAAEYEAVATRTWNGHTYTVYNSNVTWSEAQRYCSKVGGHLVTITSAAENGVVHGMLRGNYYYLGGTDAGKEGNWTWITGEKWSYSNWNRGEPNNGNGGKPQNYNAMYKDGTWDDAWTPDSYVSGFVCEWDYVKNDDEPNCDTGVSSNANDLYRKINEYLDTLKDELEKDIGTEDTIESLAKTLMEADKGRKQKMLTIPMDMQNDEKAVLAAYKVYAEYLKEWYDNKIEIGEIDINDDLTKTATELVNDLFAEFSFINEVEYADGYRVSINRTGVGSAGFGGITVKKGTKVYSVTIVSSTDEVYDVYADFIEELRDITYDAMKQVTASVLSDLGDVTGFAEWEKSEIKSALKDAADTLDAKGLGDVYRTAEKCKEVYDLIKDILDLAESESFDESGKKAEKLQKKLEEIDFTDAAVKNKAIDSALNEIKKYQKELTEMCVPIKKTLEGKRETV